MDAGGRAKQDAGAERGYGSSRIGRDTPAWAATTRQAQTVSLRHQPNGSALSGTVASHRGDRLPRRPRLAPRIRQLFSARLRRFPGEIPAMDFSCSQDLTRDNKCYVAGVLRIVCLCRVHADFHQFRFRDYSIGNIDRQFFAEVR